MPGSLWGKNREGESYSFLYMDDQYEIKSGGNIFEKTYDKQYGTLLIAGDYDFYKKSMFDLSWGLSFGLGYNQGKPRFVSGTQSKDIIFRLYTILLDASLSVDFHPVKFLKVMVKMGPSLMGLYESRNDFDSGEDGENVRQMGEGFFYHAAVKTDLGYFFPSFGKLMSQEYHIDKIFLNMGVRYHYYRGFKRERVKVDGLSYLMGLTFEL